MNLTTASKSKHKTLYRVKNVLYSNWFLPIVAAVVYLVWSVNLPMDLCPDENLRFSVPNFILSHGYLPNGFEEEIRDSEWGMSYAFSVYGSSLVSLPFMYIVSLFTQDASALVCAARLSSVLFGSLTVYMCLKIGDLLYAEPSSKVLLAVLCGFMPQFVFLSSFLNCDTISAFSASLIVYSWIKGSKSDWDYLSCFLLGLGCGICLLSYYFAYGLIIASLLVFIVLAFRRLSLKETFKKFSFVLLIVFIVAGWFFIRNIIIYQGDIFGLTSLYESRLEYSVPALQPDATSPQLKGFGIIDTFTTVYSEFNWFVYTYISFIGLFGYMAIKIPFFIYVEYTIIILGGLLAAGCTMRKLKKQHVLILIGLLLAIIIPILLSMYYSYATDYQPQGRYIISALVPMMLLVVWGIDRLSMSLDSRLLVSIHLPAIISILVIVSFIVCLVFTIVPMCTGPILGPLGTSH